MAYRFKSIADVDVVAEPTESANVLIEEDGVIKKAPKTAVGGAGAVEPDMVIELSCRLDDTFSEDYVTIVSGTYDDVAGKLVSGQLVDVRVREHREASYDPAHNEIKARCVKYDEDLNVTYAVPDYYSAGTLYMRRIRINADTNVTWVSNYYLRGSSQD